MTKNYSNHWAEAGRLINIARKKRFSQIGVSGNEPTIGREHLLKVLELLPSDINFILETNGILIGHDKTYAEDLSRFENLYVRISLKGTNEEEFSELTRAEPGGFTLQLQALENLYRAGVEVHPAAMVSFSPWKIFSLWQRDLEKSTPRLRTLRLKSSCSMVMWRRG